ncbi:MAG: DNA repair exonuclease [Hadesarchaea archaeon]|nr:DNA repair exonuclease [Hadesarchaea archaeon]
MLKIAAISDLHLGAKWGTEREEDSFDQAREAFERAIQLGAQLILVPGDIFEFRIPRQEMWAKAMRILSLPLATDGGEVKLAGTIDKKPDDISPLVFRGIPVIALHGNHERRSAGLVNPIQALESAGLLIHLHHNAVILETPIGRVAIHGMSNVPERYARDVLNTWNPKPVSDSINILMLHQSLGSYRFSEEERPTIDVADLPPGFDLYVCGHMHYHAESSIHGRPLLFPGSTIRTQLLPIESKLAKGFYLIKMNGGVSYEFVELRSPRDFYYEEKSFNGVEIPEIYDWIRSRTRDLLKKPRRNPAKAPIIRFRLRGTLAKRASRSELDTRMLEEEFQGKAILSISKGELTSPGLEAKIKFLRDLRGQQMSLEDMAMELLDSNLAEIGYEQLFDARAIYGLLTENKIDDAMSVVVEIVKKLSGYVPEGKENDNSREA